MPIDDVTSEPVTALAVLKSAGVPIHMWAWPHETESQALDQLKNIAALPWAFKHIAVMPDVHLGKGATVGSVIAMKDAVSPSAVGVDIGCGMAAVQTNLTAEDLPDDLGALRSAVEAAIPVGFNSHTKIQTSTAMLPMWNSFGSLSEKVQDRLGRAQLQMGTLGGGNHFIELCLDELDNVWIMLHSGSRNIGKELAEVHINTAKTLEHNIGLPDRDLAVFLAGTPEMQAYRNDLFWAQNYARENRLAMLNSYRNVLWTFFPNIKYSETISCHHNYVSEETHYGEQVLVTRKGAINADLGQLGIIPGSMGTASYIVRGLGNVESFRSASHGAGRVMSRSKAKKLFSVEDVAEQTRGVECRKDAGVIDEIPSSYKDIDQVMLNQQTLVEPVAKLKQLMCIKG